MVINSLLQNLSVANNQLQAGTCMCLDQVIQNSELGTIKNLGWTIGTALCDI